GSCVTHVPSTCVTHVPSLHTLAPRACPGLPCHAPSVRLRWAQRTFAAPVRFLDNGSVNLIANSAVGCAMIYCESPTLVQWQPEPLENLPRPTWTKLVAGAHELSNSIEDAIWDTNLVWPFVCGQCLLPQCAYRSVVRIARFGEHLLWLAPRARDVE